MLIKILDDDEKFKRLVERLKALTFEQFASKAVKKVMEAYEDLLNEKEALITASHEKDELIIELQNQLAVSPAENERVRSAVTTLVDFVKKS